jgi:hypothetical protein
MRIAYVSLHWPRTISSGVGKKILRQINAWRGAGHSVELFMHAAQRSVDAPLIAGKVFAYLEQGRVAGEWRRISAAYGLMRSVKSYAPDIIYLRYGMYVYPIHRLSRIASFIEEMTTNDVHQHARLGWAYGQYNRLTRGWIIRRTSGLVCISNELAHDFQNARYQKPTLVIGDGIDLENVTPLPAPKNDQPRIAFIGSPDSPWQGVDKFVPFASRFQDISIHLIGYDRVDGYTTLPDNLHLHGFLEKEQYTKILESMDCAIGSLALHRIQLNESSPLKTRECLAFGLPMVLPYKDTDLDDLDCDFLLKIPNKEDNIQTHGEAIHGFAYRMRGLRADRTMLEPRIDSLRKEEMRLKFFDQILAENHEHAHQR